MNLNNLLFISLALFGSGCVSPSYHKQKVNEAREDAKMKELSNARELAIMVREQRLPINDMIRRLKMREVETESDTN